METRMKRMRALQGGLVLAGLFYLFWAYITFDILWRSSWLHGNQDALPMFTSVNAVLGVFLLLAVKQPERHRSLIAYGAWSSLAHAFTMTIMSVEAWSRGLHREDSPQDIVIIGGIGVLLLVILPAKEPAAVRTDSPHSAGAPVQPLPAEA
jgi:hypothetical protein